MAKTFTLEEAEALLPVLESLLRGSMESRKSIESAEEELEDLRNRIFLMGGISVDIREASRLCAQRDKGAQELRDAVQEINAIGVQVKDLEIGLLDFPCEVEGGTVLLCWKLGEKGIAHWHGEDEGFAGRKPIDERILRGRRGPQ